MSQVIMESLIEIKSRNMNIIIRRNVFTLDIYVISLKNQVVFTFCGGIIILSMSNVCIS